LLGLLLPPSVLLLLPDDDDDTEDRVSVVSPLPPLVAEPTDSWPALADEAEEWEETVDRTDSSRRM
jgi:hypothetical protein